MGECICFSPNHWFPTISGTNGGSVKQIRICLLCPKTRHQPATIPEAAAAESAWREREKNTRTKSEVKLQRRLLRVREETASVH